MKQLFLKHSKIRDFLFIGEIGLIQGGQEIFFEVNCRIDQDDFEMLFKDVTRTKLIEKANDELKKKSLFFSKIAHEFKNPLLCVCELINESYDMATVFNPKNNNFNSNLDQIKSLADYLLILIKDFTHFSESNFGESSTFELQETDLFSIIDFCKKICNSLLIKSNKNDKIEFNCTIDNMLPKQIYTDEWRLKQILINLLSNSIKFTLTGKITLDVSLEKHMNIIDNIYEEENYIKFSVIDTGFGMKEELYKDLSSPFKKSFCKEIKIRNQLGSGLGLSIANEIALNLGQGLQCESKLGEGTNFWFKIPIKNQLEAKEKDMPNFILDIETKSYDSKLLPQNETLITVKLSECLLVKPNIKYSDLNILYNPDGTSDSPLLPKNTYQSIKLNGDRHIEEEKCIKNIFSNVRNKA